MTDRPSLPIAERRLETDRLLLRPFELADQPAYAAIRSNPNVARYLPGGEASAARGGETAAAIVPAFTALWDEIGYGPWAAIERETGRLIGHIGLRHLPDFDGMTEVLYALDPATWGRGYANEGAAASLAFGFHVLGLTKIVAFALPGNRASLKVMQRIGLKRRPGLVPVFGLEAIMAEISAEKYLEGIT